MVRGGITLILVLLAAPALGSKVYKWTDESGRVHYTQTPPPESAQSSSERTVREGLAPSEAMAGYCRAVGDFARRLGSAMASRVPLEAAVSAARSAEDRIRELGAEETHVREVAYFVYGMEPGYRAGRVTIDGIATLAQDRCKTGNFAVLRGPRTPGAEGPGEGQRSGSGWFASPGRVVTSLHVIAGAKRITLHLADGSTASAQVLEQDAENDLATLATSVRNVPGLPLRTDEAGLGTSVFTIGFPHSDVMGVSPKLSNGVISSTSGMRDDPSRYQISVPVQAGNSGGPLLDMQGRVVGVVASKLRAGSMLQRTGDLTENVNYAVKSTRLAGMLGESAPATDGSTDLEQLAQRVGASVVRIVAE